MTDLKDKLLQEIRDGKVAMTPRAYFTLKVAALTAIVAGIIIISVLIVNFISFSIRVNSQDALLAFGPRGVGVFLRFFPWPLLALDIILIVLLQWLIRHFRFGYKTPVLYLTAALIAGAFCLGLVLDRATPFNDRLHEGRAHLPPPVRGFYEDARKPPPEGSVMCRCMILGIEGSALTVVDTRPLRPGQATSTMLVVLPDDDRHATTTGLKVGDEVFIAGTEENGIIKAFGVRKDGGRRFFERRPF